MLWDECFALTRERYGVASQFEQMKAIYCAGPPSHPFIAATSVSDSSIGQQAYVAVTDIVTQTVPWRFLSLAQASRHKRDRLAFVITLTIGERVQLNRPISIFLGKRKDYAIEGYRERAGRIEQVSGTSGERHPCVATAASRTNFLHEIIHH